MNETAMLKKQTWLQTKAGATADAGFVLWLN